MKKEHVDVKELNSARLNAGRVSHGTHAGAGTILHVRL